MLQLIILAVTFAVGFIIGILFGRKNPSKAQSLDDLAKAAVDKAKKLTGK